MAQDLESHDKCSVALFHPLQCYINTESLYDCSLYLASSPTTDSFAEFAGLNDYFGL